MQLSHQTPRAKVRSRERARRREQGYSIVMVSLLIIPLMTFTALGVDVASWYARGLEIQRAADAAAMAGVVWLPNDLPKARSEAERVAARNGFAHDPAGTGISVTVEPVPGRPQELDVTVTDPRVPAYFGRVVMDDISLTRTARARYVLPVPLGSPHNYFGNQNINPTSNDPKLWAAVNAPYALHESGDPYAVRCANRPTAIRSCDGSGANPNYREEGYRYIIDVPEGSVGRTLTVDILDAPFARRSSVSSESGDGYDVTFGTGNASTSTYTNRMAFSYELFEADNTPLDITDNPTLSGRCSAGPGRLVMENNHGTPNTPSNNANNGNTHAGRGTWTVVCQRGVTNVGQYILQVKSSDITGQTDQGSGTNQYSVRATLSGAGDQPRVYAHGDMSILTNPTGEAGSRSNNYLAEIVPRHAGKVLRIELFDAGDGSNGQFDLSILDPQGQVPQCRYNDPGQAEISGTLRTCTIRTRNNGTGTANNLYNNQWLRIEIPLGSSYDCDEEGATPYNPGPGTSSACWWRLSYLFGGTSPTPTDRTTWRVEVLGDPVQLIR